MTTGDDTYDARVGQRVLFLRTSAGLTQSELAERVNEVGVPTSWTQQTVVKIEKGQRPLRLQEAQAVARALSVDVENLAVSDSDADLLDEVGALMRALTRANVAEQALRVATRDFLVEAASVQALIGAMSDDRRSHLPLGVVTSALLVAEKGPTRLVEAEVNKAILEGWYDGAFTEQYRKYIEHLLAKVTDANG